MTDDATPDDAMIDDAATDDEERADLADALRLQEVRAEVARARHDLRGPLNTMVLTLELLRRRAAADEPDGATIVRGVEKVVAEIRRLDGLVGERLADPEDAERPARIAVSALLQRVAARLARLGVAASIAPADPTLVALVGPRRAALALTGLGAQLGASTGDLRVEAESAEDGRVRITISTDGAPAAIELAAAAHALSRDGGDVTVGQDADAERGAVRTVQVDLPAG